MGNTQPIAQRLGFDQAHLVQREKFRVIFNEYKIKGKRETMEDYSKVVLSFAEKHFKAIPVPQQLPQDVMPTDKEYAAYFGIFDGHSGPLCAEYVTDNLAPMIEENQNFPADIPKAISESFLSLDKKWLTEEASKESNTKNFWEVDKVTHRGHLEDGCTALVCVLWEETLIVANAGDCRGLLVKDDGSFVAISRDHSPDDPTEITRIVQAGGSVKNGRINGRLGVSRGFGAYPYKQDKILVTVEPEIATFKITPATSYLILATDGVWDKLSNDEVVKMITSKVDRTADLYKTNPDKVIFDACMEVREVDNRKSSDNISIMVAAFDHIAANTEPTPGQGLLDSLRKKTGELSAAVMAKKDEISKNLEPKLAELNDSARNSSLNATLKIKSKEIGEKMTEQTAGLVSTVNNLLKSSQGPSSNASSDLKTPEPETRQSTAQNPLLVDSGLVEPRGTPSKSEAFVEVSLDESPAKKPHDSDEELHM